MDTDYGQNIDTKYGHNMDIIWTNMDTDYGHFWSSVLRYSMTCRLQRSSFVRGLSWTPQRPRRPKDEKSKAHRKSHIL